jgi:5-hydroxyisourate hydrolase
MITTHVLDLSSGKPAAGVRVSLSRLDGANATTVGSGTTDGDGRLKDLVPHATKLPVGTFQLTFETGAYFRGLRVESFHPRVVVTFSVTDPKQHYHVPLLISPFGYSTYRGS